MLSRGRNNTEYDEYSASNLKHEQLVNVIKIHCLSLENYVSGHMKLLNDHLNCLECYVNMQ